MWVCGAKDAGDTACPGIRLCLRLVLCVASMNLVFFSAAWSGCRLRPQQPSQDPKKQAPPEREGPSVMAAAPATPLFSLFLNSSAKICAVFLGTLTTALWTFVVPVFGLEMGPQSQVRVAKFCLWHLCYWADSDHMIGNIS